MNKDDVVGLVERLDAATKDDHERGCQGRYYACSCGHDDSNAQLLQDSKDALTTLSAKVETLEAGMSQYLKDGQTPLERMEQDQADILGLMKLLQKEKELTEKLRWALSDAVTTNTESCRERDAALHRIETLQVALTPFAKKCEYADAMELCDDDYVECAPLQARYYYAARQALAGDTNHG